MDEQRARVEAGGELDRHPGAEQEVSARGAEEAGGALHRRFAGGIDEEVGAGARPDHQVPAGQVPALRRQVPAKVQGYVRQADRRVCLQFGPH